MNHKNQIPSAVMSAAANMLAGFVPGLTVEKLNSALHSIERESTPRNLPDMPVTRKQAAQMLQVSLPTVDRWTRSGKLPAIKLAAHTVRIPLASIQALISGEA